MRRALFTANALTVLSISPHEIAKMTEQYHNA
jgi:hypothetical protein